MRTLLNHLSIGRRLGASFGVLAVLVAVVAGTGLYSAGQQMDIRADQHRLQQMRDDVKELRYYDSDVSGWQGFIFSEAMMTDPASAVLPDADNMSGLLEDRAAVEKLLQGFDQGALTSSEQKTFATIEQQWSAFFAATDDWSTMLGAAETDAQMHAAFEYLNAGALATTWSDLLKSTQKLVDSVDERAADLEQHAHDAANRAKLAILLVGVLVLALAFLLGIAVTRSIVRPLGRVRDAVGRVAEGDLTATPEVHQRDEVGQLAESFDTTMESLRGIVATMAESAATVATTAEEIEAASNTISGSAQDASTEAQAVTAAADAVSHNVQTVAAGSEQMGASIQEIARNAHDAAGVAADAVRIAEETGVTVTKLGSSSQEIGDVVKVITSIAEQTNLLALNATIEAARAGEAGKGFAVVANEVKELAQETARATGDIAQRVQAIQADATGAVDAIEQIGEVVARISDSQTTIAAAVEEQTLTTQEMNRNVSDAATGSGEIATTIGRVATATHGTTQGVADLRDTVTGLSQMSGQLRELVASFRYQ